MVATVVWRLTLHHMQDIACEYGSLKTTCQIDFTFCYGLCTSTSNTSNIIDLGHSMKIKMATTTVWRLTLYPKQDIFCESVSLKTAYLINLQLIFGHPMKNKMAAIAGWLFIYSKLFHRFISCHMVVAPVIAVGCFSCRTYYNGLTNKL